MQLTLKRFWTFITLRRHDIEGCIISSVVPQITNAVKLAAEKILKKEVMVSRPWRENRTEYYDG